MNAPCYVPYQPRPIQFHEPRDVHGQRLELYSIRYGQDPIRWDVFEPGLTKAYADVPAPDVACGRPGLGFVIAHQGRTGDYIILGWWDSENELPLRVFVRDQSGWRTARSSESVCVWDLEVIWHERQAYVATLLAGGSPDAYLASVMASPPAP